MESRAKLLGHPVHQMLIPIPAGLFVVAAILDLVDRFVDARWIPTVTYWNIAIGVVSAILAALFGWIDWSKIPSGTRAKRVGLIHAFGNGTAIALFAIALWLRSQQLDYMVTNGALALELAAFALLGVAAWFGGELVDRLGIGVDEGAHADAPNSLRTRHIPSPRV